jgi:hypothetical protein
MGTWDAGSKAARNGHVVAPPPHAACASFLKVTGMVR